ncbi:MAG: nucleotidyltransferase [Bacteroidales bacterium]|nr:nucleotidyltransferase [Bacteroidales bacterium]
MTFPVFYTNIISALNENGVEYLIIGGHAVNYHGYVRVTADMDIWINNNESNLKRLFKALIQLGFKEEKCTEAIRFFKVNHIIKIPKNRNLIELMDDFMVRIEFDKAYSNREIAGIEGLKINIIGYNELIESKSKSLRFKDMNDVKELQEIKKMIDKKSDQGIKNNNEG